MNRKTFRFPHSTNSPSAIAEGLVINVGEAKDQFASLIEYVSQGNEVTIATKGKPNAKLVPARGRRRTFRVNWDLLKSMPVPKQGLSAQKIIREDRDGRS
jgi:prevent-host-death family protein